MVITYHQVGVFLQQVVKASTSLEWHIEHDITGDLNNLKKKYPKDCML